MPDLIVAGAGIIGASVAWRAAQAGLRVMLLDGGAFGREASWAGAGMLAPGGETEKAGAWTDFAVQSLDLYRGFVGELTAESGVKIDYRQTGALEIAACPEDWERLQSRAAAQSGSGISSRPVDRHEARDLLGSEFGGEFTGGLYYPADACVDPRHVLQALRLACRRREVEIREGCPVRSLKSSANSVEAVSEGGTLKAGAAVITAGAWSSRIEAPQPLRSCFPVKGHLLGYRLHPDSLRSILRAGHTYVLQRANGFTIAGSSTEQAGFDRRIDPEIVADIGRRALRLLPALASGGPPEAWAGFRPGVEGDPEIRRLGDTRIWLAYGHYRNGILLAPATAARVVRYLRG